MHFVVNWFPVNEHRTEAELEKLLESVILI